MKPRRHGDVGLRALGAIHHVLRIDNEWTSRGDRQFTWYAHRLAQSVVASPCFDDAGFVLSRITVEVGVVEDVKRSAQDVMKYLTLLNQRTIGHALIYRARERRIDALLAHVVHEETVEMRSREIASNQIAMLAVCEHQAEGLAELVDGRVAVRWHPLMGARRRPDDRLLVLSRHFAPRGAESSKFASQREVDAIAEEFRDSLVFTAGGSEDGIALEIAFGEDETTLVQLLTSVRHPDIGSGLGVFTTVRWVGTPEECAALANQLNLAQFEPFEPHSALGAWCVRDVRGQFHLAHCRFVPNADYLPMRSLECAWASVYRARWLDQRMFPGLPERYATTIIMRRIRNERRTSVQD